MIDSTPQQECIVKRTCFFCGSDDRVILWEGHKIPTTSPKDAGSFKLVKCKRCGAIRVDPAPCEESLISYYPGDYYDYDSSDGSLVNNIIGKFYGKKRFRILLASFNSDLNVKKKVLEIGPGRGENLVPFLNQGYLAFAIEPNEKLAGIVKGLGVNVENSFFERVSILPSDFDVVILSHVLEHEYDPNRMLAYCKEHMRNGGNIYIEIPVLDALSFRVFGRFWGDLEFPMHLSLMKRSHLEKMLERTGFSIVQIKYRTLLGDTMRSFEKIFEIGTPDNKVKQGLIQIIGAAYQLLFTLLDKLTGKGDAIVVIAKKT